MKKINLNKIWPAIVFLLASLIITWPVIVNIKNTIFGYAGDPFGSLWWLWWKKYALLNHLDSNFTSLLSAPWGTMVSNFAVSISDWLALGLGIIFGSEVAGYNLVILINIFLAGFAMHWLVTYLTKNKLAGIFSGIAFMFSSYLLAHSQQHLGLSGIFWFPLIILYLLKFSEEAKWKNICFSGVFIGGAIAQNFYYGYMALILTLVFAIYFLAIKIIKKENALKFISQLILIGIIALVLSLPITYNSYYEFFNKSNAVTQNTTVRSGAELSVYSAKWINYFYPSPDNPIFGKFTKNAYNDSLKQSGSNIAEQSLYLGIIPILLMIYGLWQIAKAKDSPPIDQVETNQESRIKIFVLFLLLLAIVTFYFSFTSTISLFRINFKTPANYIFQYLPYFRVYARFGLIVILSVSILAGTGLSVILNHVKNKKIATLLYVFLVLFLLAELINFPLTHSVNVSKNATPKIYENLAKLDRGIVVEYPLLPTQEPLSYNYLLWQRYHQMPLVYGAIKGTKEDDFRKSILDPGDSETINKLGSVGVKYLIVHMDSYTKENIKKYPLEYNLGVPPQISSNRLEFISQSKNDLLYRIITP
jgi:hypothetical protein